MAGVEMTTRAAELARKARWPHWWNLPGKGPYDGNADNPRDLDPEHDLDHAIALAECRWPGYDMSLEREQDLWVLTVYGMYEGTWQPTPALAVCAALDAAGEKDASD